MTKQLLTVLFIAGLSATAQAIPVIWECQSSSLAITDADGTNVKENIDFMLIVDSEAGAIYPKGALREYTGGEIPEPVLVGGFQYATGSWLAWDSLGTLKLHEKTGELGSVRQLRKSGYTGLAVVGKCKRQD